MTTRYTMRDPNGPFRADQLRPGDRYELSDGHAIYCAPTGGSGARSTVAVAQLLDSDPAVESAGIDAGFKQNDKNLRAPDVSIGVPDEPGWIDGAPPLAVEVADRGQDEAELRLKIRELLAAGTQIIWVVRLKAPRHVEVHTPSAPMQRAYVGTLLTAPGILKNPVPVEALWDRRVSQELTFKNLLDRRGYASLDAVYAEGREEGRAEGIEQGIERGFEQGLERGIEKGIEQGIEKGIEQGIEKGIEKGLEQGLERGIEQTLEPLRAALLASAREADHTLSAAAEARVTASRSVTELIGWTVRIAKGEPPSAVLG